MNTRLLVQALLTPHELASIRTALAGARFVDGRVSAQGPAREQKHVLQLDRTDNAQRGPGELVAKALLRDPRVQAFALPRSLRHPTINRYEQGMRYGAHLDAPILHGALPMRADVSVTVFLSEPADYAGGELVIGEGVGAASVKAAAGDALLYASGAIHHVNEVTAGVRLVAVTWIESLVRDPEQRRLLFELGEGIAAVEREAPATAALIKLRACHQNLLRSWAESPGGR
ncbi:MAG TPA: Fe2+-dependent dioxygenase [Polyangiaceae bacterium]|nr:Fe2+-dependent dioxygenase [Polyangiaceae bacterium]